MKKEEFLKFSKAYHDSSKVVDIAYKICISPDMYDSFWRAQAYLGEALFGEEAWDLIVTYILEGSFKMTVNETPILIKTDKELADFLCKEGKLE